MVRCRGIARNVIVATAFVCLMPAGLARAADERCVAAMQERVRQCTDTCMTKAREAVDPEMKDVMVNHACANNCLKIQMFQGRSCS